MLFRSLQKLLMDTAAHEYLFCCDFWGEDGVYTELFTPVLGFVETSLSAVLQVGGTEGFWHWHMFTFPFMLQEMYDPTPCCS